MEHIHEKIQELAYQLYLKRGGVPGHDKKDWFEAEQKILAAIGKPTLATAKKKKDFSGLPVSGKRKISTFEESETEKKIGKPSRKKREPNFGNY